jgi:hypothetical protein
MSTESTVTRPVSTRMRHDDIERLARVAEARGLTVSSLLCSFATDALSRAESNTLAA